MTEILQFEDAASGCRGWLAYNGRTGPLAAGGCRVQPGVTEAELAALAERMSLKQRVLGLNVDGAKCGIDYSPAATDKQAVLARFLVFLRDELYNRFSMGPDMGTQWRELQTLAAVAGVPSVKYAIARAQGLSDGEFFRRMATLEERTGMLTLSERRAGHALAHAVIAAAQADEGGGRISCALQGFGNLGRAAAYTLYEEGMCVTAVADENGCIADGCGLDVVAMLRSPHGTAVPELPVGGRRLPAGAIFDTPADVLVLAACADAMNEEHTAAPPFASVVVGANCGLSDAAEESLHTRGVFVVPDFIGGIGGSASMEALFGPPVPPAADEVLGNLAHLMHELVRDVWRLSRRHNVTPREAALRIAGSATVDPGAPPYGHCPYLTARAD
jgi:glutamate dehydrogenase (NAD(P)+)